MLFQLRQFTQLMQEGRLEGASPEMEAEEVPYGADWEGIQLKGKVLVLFISYAEVSLCLIYLVGYPEETYPVYNDDDENRDDDDEEYHRPRITTFTMVKASQQPSAEALAERMEQVEEQAMARKLSIVREVDEEEGDEEEEEGEETDEDIEDEEEEEAEAEKRQLLSGSLAQLEREERLGLEVSNELQGFNGGKKQISFSEHRDVFHYPKEETYEEEEQEGDGDEEDEGEGEEETDEDDPVIEAESLQFSGDGCLNPEEEAERAGQESLLMPEDRGGGSDGHTEVPRGAQASGLRMRNRREK